jgi:hypothetical protein
MRVKAASEKNATNGREQKVTIDFATVGHKLIVHGE